ncbi:MAG: PAS domain S-box protein [Desulfobacterales bacterium]|nr:MAG: PAS domain S-box protein [Desulfobacterales bacterium]
MSEQPPLYNSRITKIYIQYLRRYHPNIDIAAVLKEAGLAIYEIEDPAHWFTQDQVDRFHDILVQRTSDPDVSRKVGRYAATSEGMGAAKQYILGLMSPAAIYLLMERIIPYLMSRAVSIRAKKLGTNKVEIISIPKPAIEEKPYQCANRTGTFESLATWFTAKFATIDHPECIHKGDDCCRYIISWGKAPSHIWKRMRNYALALALAASAALLPFLSVTTWSILVLLAAFVITLLSFNALRLEKKALIRTIETQREVAQDSIAESNIRYNNALLVQEIGQATSKILDIERLLTTVAQVMEKRLDFDRGMIMLANREKTRLRYGAGYGHTVAHEESLRQTEFSLDKPESRGIFVLAFREQKPFLVSDINEIVETISARSLDIAQKMGTQSLICVPIVYEKESLGILTVDNSKSKRPLRQSDLNLLMGVASQLAISIINALSFEKLHDSEKKYRELIENANSIILRMDPEGNIIFFNEFAQRFFGYTEKDILGQKAQRFILSNTAADRPVFRQLIASLQRDPEPPNVRENETKRKNGEKIWITWTYKPIFDPEGHLKEILCVGNDVTQLKHAAQEKMELETQLQRAQKMEAIGTLAGGVAHDLNNILSGIVSYPELLLMDLKEDSPLREPILTIQKSGEKAAAIVQDLLTLARRGVAATEVVNLNAIVLEYLLSPVHTKLKLIHPHVEVVQNLNPHLLNVIGSPVHLSKTVMNLVSNAAEAMPDGGRITITTANRHVDKLQNGYDDVATGDYVTLTIADVGIGIGAADLERIFEPFYTKKAMGRSGTGLGMAVVWGTVKDHKGFIDIQSREGQGTEITLYFPVTRKEFARNNVIISLQDFMGQGESILVVDDVAEQRSIASSMLKKLGYSVTTVSSGEEAVAYLKHRSADLIVLDMIMDPGMDGLETYQQILNLNPRQKTIIASGYSESVRVKTAQKLGAGAYLKKPYLLEEIARMLRAELDR